MEDQSPDPPLPHLDPHDYGPPSLLARLVAAFLNTPRPKWYSWRCPKCWAEGMHSVRWGGQDSLDVRCGRCGYKTQIPSEDKKGA